MLTSLWLLGCGLDPARVAAHPPYATSGAAVTDDRFAFAVVGATRSLIPGADDAAGPTLADLSGQLAARDVDLVVLTGGYVRKSDTAGWASFDERFGDVIASERPSDVARRVPVLAVPGDAERLGDKALVGYGAAFPKQGEDIGLGRVASWGAVDVRSGPKTWRFVWVDPHEAALGSRWQEQLFWLPKAVSEGFDHLVVFAPESRFSTVAGRADDPDGDLAELLAVIDEHSPMASLVGVFSGGPATNELLLPTGTFGEAHVVAGNAGVAGVDLLRAEDADAGGSAIEPAFDDVVRTRLLDAKERLSPKAVEAAPGGTYAAEFPVQGYWVVEINGGRLLATFRMHTFGTFADVYAARWTKKDGWVAGPPAPPT